MIYKNILYGALSFFIYFRSSGWMKFRINFLSVAKKIALSMITNVLKGAALKDIFVTYPHKDHYILLDSIKKHLIKVL